MPQFSPNENKIAALSLPITPSGLSCVAELYLTQDGIAKATSSGLIPFVSTGAIQNIQLPIVMPSSLATYLVRAVISSGNAQLGAYQAIDNVVIAAPVTTPGVLLASAASDCWIWAGYPNDIEEDTPFLIIRDRGDIEAPPPMGRIRSLLEFDISVIPALKAIGSAILRLYYYDAGYGLGTVTGKNVLAYKLTRTGRIPFKTTWNYFNYESGILWTTPGGDYVTSNPSASSAIMPGAYGLVSWDITDIVRDAHALGIPVALLIKYEIEDRLDFGPAWFYSREYTDDISLCPQLEINYV